MTVFAEPRRVAAVFAAIRSWRAAEASAGEPVCVGNASHDRDAKALRR